jgi:hypothetical protein
VYSILLRIVEKVTSLAIPLLGLGAWLRWLEGPRELSFQRLDEDVGAGAPAGARVAT